MNSSFGDRESRPTFFVTYGKLFNSKLSINDKNNVFPVVELQYSSLSKMLSRSCCQRPRQYQDHKFQEQDRTYQDQDHAKTKTHRHIQKPELIKHCNLYSDSGGGVNSGHFCHCLCPPTFQTSLKLHRVGFTYRLSHVCLFVTAARVNSGQIHDAMLGTVPPLTVFFAIGEYFPD